jgi:ABC-type cobalamin/Fe3+-siderophores transport system ATPase subunit
MVRADERENSSLITRQLSVGWSGLSVARGIDAIFPAGEITAITGPNGAGKSTLLKTLARLIRPVEGEVNLDEVNIYMYKPKEFARMVAYLPQSLEPGQDLTVQELALLGRNPHQSWWSWSLSAEDKDAVKVALERTEMWGLRDRYLSVLSGGERQRAIIAMALAQKPRFMLWDEPAANLDFRHQLELMQIFRELTNSGIGVVAVLHDLNTIFQIADQVLMLKKQNSGPSQVAGFGAPPTVLTPELLRSVYDVDVRLVREPNTGQVLFSSQLPMSAADK